MDAQTRRMNDAYRDEEPSDTHVTAFLMALSNGTVPENARKDMVDTLYEPFSDDLKDTPVDPWEPTLPTKDEGNGLAKAVTRDGYGITIHVSEKLYHQQPIGVLLRPINDAVRKRGEALVTRTDVYAEGIQPEVMDAKHYSLRVEPLPCWLTKWIGSDGYPTQ